jgi:hypothetical protein
LLITLLPIRAPFTTDPVKHSGPITGTRTRRQDTGPGSGHLDSISDDGSAMGNG